MQLKDKVALVTGAGSGIGKAAAILLAKKGAYVGVLDGNEDHAGGVCDEITKAGGSALPLTTDVSDPVQLQRAVKKLTDHWHRLDIVFANAGINGVWAPIDEITPEEWNTNIAINLTGTFLTIKYCVPHLKKNGGSVIVTSSVNGTRIFSNTGATAYSCSKAGQVAMTQMLALELARDNIRVNAICPGAVETNINQSTEQRDLGKVKSAARYERTIPLSDHPAKAEQVAQLVLFLASDASSHITGTPIWIDGAQSLLQG